MSWSDRLPTTWKKLFPKKRYIVIAKGWSVEETSKLSEELNNTTNQFIVRNREVDVKEV